MEYRQKNWPEWLASAEFAVNNKIHTAMKVLLFIANYGRELRMRGNIRRRYKKKRKGRESNRICRKDEEST